MKRYAIGVAVLAVTGSVCAQAVQWTGDLLDLNDDGIEDSTQTLVPLLRVVGSGASLNDLDIDQFGRLYTGNSSNSGGTIFRISGSSGLLPYGPSLSDPDTVCVNEGPALVGYPEEIILVGRENSITGVFPDGSIEEVMGGGAVFSNVDSMNVGGDGKLGWIALNPSPNLRSTWSNDTETIASFNLLGDSCLSAVNDQMGRTWFFDGDTIYRSNGDPSSDAQEMGAGTFPIDLGIGLSPALTGGVFVLDRDSLRWLDVETGEDLLLLNLEDLPDLPLPLDEMNARFVGTHESNNHLALLVAKQSSGAPGNGVYAIYDVFFPEFFPEGDCNDNGVPDSEDLANGTSQDCNANDIPDECDIAIETSQDCNANDIPDECDIADGTSSDCNANSIPDECESLADCDGDGTSDACEILGGALDVNPADGVPDECQGLPAGACCVNGACMMGTAANCFAAEGSYAGDGVSCADAGCPADCPTDVFADGVTDINDLLLILSEFGSVCP